MAVWMLLSLLGTLSGHHFSNRAHSLRVISNQTLVRLQFLIPAIIVCASFWAHESLFRVIFLIFVLHLAPPLLMLFNHHVRRRRLLAKRLRFMDELLLKMRTGKSLRESLKEAALQKNFSDSRDLVELPSFLEVQTNFSASHLLPEAREMLAEFVKWDQTQVKTIEKLKAYRFQVRQTEKFRQKSRQVTEQVKSQALVCAFLYVGLLLWTGSRSPEDLFTTPVLLSLPLFLIGLGAFFVIGRSFKWKT